MFKSKKTCSLCDEQDRLLTNLKRSVPKTLSTESYARAEEHAAQIKAACAAREHRLPLV